MTKDELTELADDCWEDKNGLNTFNHLKFAALVAAHERKKQAEQEPVAWRCTRNGFLDINYADDDESLKYFERRNYDIEPLYAAPVRTKDPCHPWQDLTDDEIEGVMTDEMMIGYTEIDHLAFARAVITKFKEKNK